jgi:hypothetical protein
MVCVTGTETGYAPPDASAASSMSRCRFASRTDFCSVISCSVGSAALDDAGEAGVDVVSGMCGELL